MKFSRKRTGKMKVLFSNLFYIYDEWKYSIIIITEIHYYKRHVHLISSQKVSQCIIDVKVVPEMGQVSRFTIQFHINFPYKCSLLEPHSNVRDTFDRSHTKIKINTSIKRMEFERSRKNALRFEILWKSRREIGRRSFMYDFCGRKAAYPSLPRSVFFPIYVSPIRIASNCGDSFRTCVQIQCRPLHRESYLTGWSISFRFNPWNAIHHGGYSPCEKKLICHEMHGFVPYTIPYTRIH